ncbi:DNA-binding LacI/PurR family transcriptional regulator [Actinoplanes octamycinicus]|uniref:DNA-binding LacI/PurR family transcriptional regulator n=1 Tax=Actinoplanes octamycinicus TaxID=135948 RepID=A0A7W7H4G2_9ACTN|nr:LacI family DNA-binding transcriptional regulator [Actinoplanes octamycinicus]MBB4743818.1 DNA-binding LacI/PurR family transcriptional regulator [Actinoplanes octamycinicus]GIE58447.1 LacI family transcriptional regulator [Actinoplanes octamycinicus]
MARTTVQDVAREAGVSVSTVSRALTGGTVSASTREAVQAIAARLGYQPNRAARGLITGRTGNLGLIVPDLRNPFFADVAKGVTARARAVDYGVFITDTDEDPVAELEALASLGRNTDGVLLCSPRSPDADLRKAADPATTVLLHRRVPGLSSVVADIADGIGQAVRHLIASGHRRIAYVGGPEDSWAARQRLAVLSEVPEVMVLDPVAPTFEGGLGAADPVLAGPATAVLAYNDLVALGLLHRLAARGVPVPGRISVVGFDDVSLAAMSHPPLTTVTVPKDRSGSVGLDLLLGHTGAPGDQMILPTHLVVRGSSDAPPS